MDKIESPCRTPRSVGELRAIVLTFSVLVLTVGCQKSPPPQTQQSDTTAASTASIAADPSSAIPAAPNAPAEPAAVEQPPAATAPPVAPPAPTPSPLVVPAGTRITIRLDSPLSSKTSQVGEQFSATLAKAIRVKGTEILGAQTAVIGKVIDAKAAGKFAGASSLGLRIVSVSDHPVAATAYSQRIEGKGERSAVVIGGTAIAGALLGGLAGHGKGALIGGAAGGGVGTLGAAETGNDRDIVLPAGSVLTFKLTKALTLDAAPAS